MPLPLSILIVDDSELNRLILGKTLEMLGQRCTLADSGAQALELIDKDQPDLILMDCEMPEMDGYQATKAVLLKHPEIPIYAVTAAPDRDIHQRCQDAGMRGLIEKPVDNDRLLALIKTHGAEGTQA